ncbi:hypothetical protein BDZ94DRAFT_1186357 [Collybia nuda]|uniref:Uncharacterized protein n=1 Tax=Collybia nuda TaxID=64659 RepID=A0A9P5YDG5_9AGAR|nr:hypothetical protein BDZ94DRAFT_1186357 [Collybia nuda]
MNATSPPNPLVSTNTEGQRNVWNIVWSCLVTISACVWIAVHPNIPASTDTQLVVAVRRAGLMMCALIAPEVIILWAMRQWYSARKIAQKHTSHGWKVTHGFFLQMGGFMLYSGDKALHPLQLAELEELHRMGKIDWPSITVEEIEDRSKGDALSKSLVILQTTWFLAQCIIRTVKGFLLTELELVTLAFATLNAATYFFWWNKPLDIRCQVPVRIKLELEDERLSINKPPKSEEVSSTGDPPLSGFGLPRFLRKFFVSIIRSVKRVGSNIQRSFRERDMTVNFLAQLHYLTVAFFHIFLRIVNTINGYSPDGNLRVPTFYAAHLAPNPRVFFLMSISCAMIGTVFGAVHCIAWSFNFPSPYEQLLWRISSLVVTFAPIRFPSSSWKLLYAVLARIFYRLLLLVITTIYILARFGLIFQAFAGLRNLSPGVLQDIEWTNYIPHL